jgi:hypothetical protein
MSAEINSIKKKTCTIQVRNVNDISIFLVFHQNILKSLIIREIFISLTETFEILLSCCVTSPKAWI